MGNTTRLSEKDRTQRPTRRNRGLPSLGHSAALCRQRNSFYSAMLLDTYISRFSVDPHYQQKRNIRQSCRHKFYPQLFLIAVSTSRTNAPRSLLQAKVSTHSALLKGSHTRAHTPKQGAFRVGGGITTLGLLHMLQNPCVTGCQNGVLCRFWILVGGAPEGHREPAEQRCAHARRCSEASRPRWAA